MRILFYFILLIGSYRALAQSRDRSILLPGVYKGGICQDDGLCGTWYLRADSLFVYTSWDATGRLKSYGSGKWNSIGDKEVYFLFTRTLQPVQPIQIEWQSETKAPYDSIFITGLLKKGNQPAGFVSVTGHEKTVTSDKNGSFKITQTRSNSSTMLRVTAAPQGLLPVTIEFPAQNNSYRITVQLPVNDSSSCVQVYDRMLVPGEAPGIRLPVSGGGKKSTLGIHFEPDAHNALIDQLRNAALLQPMIASVVKELITAVQAQ